MPDPIEINVDDSTSPNQESDGDPEMSIDLNQVTNATSANALQALQQSGNIAQNNFITVQKVVDYDYLENKRMVTLDEAVGVREVQSQVNPGGPAPRPTA